MKVGVALPQMAQEHGPGTTVDWARAIDSGPFSSVSAGERVTFSNPEMVATLGACAAVTERVRIFANLWVLPQHAMAMVAQQIGTLDQLARGRLDVAVGNIQRPAGGVGRRRGGRVRRVHRGARHHRPALPRRRRGSRRIEGIDQPGKTSDLRQSLPRTVREQCLTLGMQEIRDSTG